jgi:hypothetical protein
MRGAGMLRGRCDSKSGYDDGGAAMSTTNVDFPRREIKLAQGPQYLALFGAAAVFGYLTFNLIDAVAPGTSSIAARASILSGVVVFSVCLGVGFKLLSRIDFSKVVLAIDQEGVYVALPQGLTAADQTAGTIPWSSIATIKYYASGRLKETKTIVVEMRDFHHRAVSIPANLLRGANSRELYETMRRYQRQFAPAPKHSADGPVYQSASWTGLDED